MKTFDIYLVGVGGQGVLTIGEIITETAFRAGKPANFYPTKGMAQRGGAVKAQLRLGRSTVGPAIPERGADLVIATGEPYPPVESLVVRSRRGALQLPWAAVAASAASMW